MPRNRAVLLHEITRTWIVRIIRLKKNVSDQRSLYHQVSLQELFIYKTYGISEYSFKTLLAMKTLVALTLNFRFILTYGILRQTFRHK